MMQQTSYLYWVQTRFPDVGTASNGNLIALSGANAITGQTSGAVATPNTTSGNTKWGFIHFWLLNARTCS